MRTAQTEFDCRTGVLSMPFKQWLLSSAFQPIYRLHNQQLIGHECLLRAKDSENRPVAPQRVFSSAGNLDLIHLDRIARALHINTAKDKGIEQGWLFLNVHSGTAGYHEEYQVFFDRLTRYCDIPRNRIVIELVDTHTEDKIRLAQVVGFFKEQGCQVALGNFGRGHTDLDYIWAIAPDLVKLDRRLLRRARQEPVVLAAFPELVALLQKAGIQVVMEGVEDKQGAYLALKSGVDLVQGFFFSRPLSEDLAAGEWGKDDQGVVRLRNISDAYKQQNQAEITNLRQANKVLETARDQAEAANKTKDAFFAMMSHEIRNPMNVMFGTMDLLMMGELNRKQRKHAETIQGSMGVLLTITNDILDYSKFETGRFKLNASEFFLSSLFSEVVELFQDAAKKKGIRLYTTLQVEDWLLQGDPVRLRQVLMNLLGNALKFTKDGEVEVCLQTKKEEAEQVKMYCEVRDTGMGIAETEQQQVFDAYFRTENGVTKGIKGTGLGLAICKQLVGLMGGEIGVDSTPNRGSVFWFTASLKRLPQGLH